MKRYLHFSIILFVLLFLVVKTYAQSTIAEGIPVTPAEVYLSEPTKPLNFSSISVKERAMTEQWRKVNQGYENHPDALLIPVFAPDDNAIEILHKRTETTRYFVDATNPTLVYSQGALGPLHYKSGDQWRTIDHRLNRKTATIVEATNQPLPVGFDTAKQTSYIQMSTGKVRFNQWAITAKDATGSKQTIAVANWESISVGDDGVEVKEIFPGIDAQMKVETGAIKTTFFVRTWHYAEYSEVLLEDTYEKGMQPIVFMYDQVAVKKGRVAGELLAKEGKNILLQVGKAFMYVEEDASTAVDLAYEIEGQTLGMVLNTQDMTELLKVGTVIIDPLVQGREGRYTPAAPISSFRTRDNPACNNYAYEPSCSYSWTVPIPGGIEIINTTHLNNMQVIAPCTRDKMAFRIVLGDDMKCGSDILWYPEGRPATSGGVGGSPNVITNYNDCLPVKCEDTDLNISLSILRACMGPNGCGSSCVQGSGPFVTTVTGRTLEVAPITASVNIGSEICPEEVVQLKGQVNFGIKPYTYNWSDGTKGETKEVKPSQTSTYKVEIVDACHNKVEESVTLKVKQATPPPTVTIAQENTSTACIGDVMTWSSQVNTSGNYGYQWQINSTDVRGATGPNWESDSRSVQLKKEDKVTLAVTVREQCFADYVVTSNALNPDFYDLPLHEDLVEIIGCGQVEHEGQLYTESTDLTEMFRNKNGCDSLRRTYKIIVEHFAIELNALTPTEIFEGQPIHLSVKSDSPDFTVVQWEPPHLFTNHAATEQQLIGNQSQQFIVHAISSSNCQASDTLALRVNSPSNVLLMPTAFTPNGDQRNDVWEPVRLQDFPEGEIFVYNRWGQCVYHTQNYAVPWDGKYNSKVVPSGVYTYRLLIPGRKEIKGTVSVLY